MHTTRLLLPLLGLIAVPAAAQQPKLQPATEHEISAQINVTRDRTALLLQKVGRDASGPVSAADYARFKREFRDRVEAALVKYEGNLKNDVLNRVALWMDRYNAIVASQDYPAEQKKLVLDQQYQLIGPQMAEISAIYSRYIGEIYALAGKIPMVYADYEARLLRDDPADCKYERAVAKNLRRSTLGGFAYAIYPAVQLLDGTTFRSSPLCAVRAHIRGAYPGYLVQGPPREAEFTWQEAWSGSELHDSEGPSSKGVDPYLPRVFAETTYPALRQHCRSQICISLVASDLTMFLSSVLGGIDQDLEFNLADGKPIRLKAGTLPGGPANLAFEQLRKTDYPADYRSLPYDTAK